MPFELTSDEVERDYVRLGEYCEFNELKSTRQVAAHFDIAQTTATRWLKNPDLWVITAGHQGPWQQVYVEKVLRTVSDVPGSPE
jgi:hypothetical protein